MENIAFLSIAILVILLVRTIYVVRSEKMIQRGVEPSDGSSEIIVDYSSGMGGGQYYSYKIPQDPQKYAQIFVPKNRKKS